MLYIYCKFPRHRPLQDKLVETVRHQINLDCLQLTTGECLSSSSWLT
jgi:hypothetical protein